MKKSSYLQTLYLQKPWLLIILIAIVATLPWIGLGDFYTKGEPREAALAISMLEHGNWIIPYGYADEFAYKPPLNHWIIAGVSYLFNGGEVTPFTSRLPSVLGFIGLIGVCFMFFARRRSPLEAFVACLIIITCFEIHRAAVTTRLDMLLTFFMVTGIIQMFIWEEKKKKRYLVGSWVFLTLAVLVKGPIGVVLPCAIFGVYLLIERYNFFKAVGKCVLVAIPAFIVPLIWYKLAYDIKGEEFLTLVFAENFGRFLRLDNKDFGLHYKLGVENPWWFYPVSLSAGFVPWTLLMAISLFFLKYTKPTAIKEKLITWWNRFSQNKVLLYSFLAIVFTLIFYTVPSSKRSVYVMPIYPFIALFMAQFMIYLVQNKAKAVRIFTYILVSLASVIALLTVLSVTHIIDLESLGHLISKRERTLYDIKLFSDGFKSPTVISIVCLVILVYAIARSFYILKKQSNLKVLMAAFGIMFSLNLFLDGALLPSLKNAYSSRPFAESLKQKYPDLKDNVYVINDLFRYPNMYGLNFYLGNNFKNIEKEQPESGYFLMVESAFEDLSKEYSEYTYTKLDSVDRYTDYKAPIVLYKIQRK